MTISRSIVLEFLENIKHPGKKEDIVSLNMVEDLQVDGEKISFNLVFPGASDPFVESLKKACVIILEQKLGEDIKIKGNIGHRFRMIREEEEVLPHVRNIIAIASGKGGVGKSTVAANLAVSLTKKGYNTGLMDADIYGPSIPKMFQLEDARPEVRKVNGKDLMVPVEKYGVKLLSIGFFVDPTEALIWRGPMATSALKQLIGQGDWGALDYLLIDLPPGTSDIHLTMVQEISVTGVIIVSTPQDIALADVVKGIAMFKGENIDVPVLGLVENMAWFTTEELPDHKYYIFGKDGCKNLAIKYHMPLLQQIPIVQDIREGGDLGLPVALEHQSVPGRIFQELAENVVKAVDKRNAEKTPTKKVKIKTSSIPHSHTN